MLSKKAFSVKKDTVIDLLSFLLGIAAGALTVHFFRESIKIPPIVFMLLCGFALVGLVRIIFPYSRTPRSERKKLDAMSRKMTEGAFSQSRICKARLMRAVRLFHNNQFRRSLKTLDKLYSHISNEQDMFAVSFFTGMCCFKFEFYDDAIDEFLACLSVREDSTVLSNLGNCYLKRERYADAEGCFRQAYELAPDDPFVSNGLALALYKQNDIEGAFKYAEISVKFENVPYTSYAIAAICSAKLMMLDEAGNEISEKYFNKLTTVAPNYSKQVRAILDGLKKQA